MQLDFAASIRPRSLLAGRACPSKLITGNILPESVTLSQIFGVTLIENVTVHVPGTESGEPPLRTMLRLTEVKRSASLRFLKQVSTLKAQLVCE